MPLFADSAVWIAVGLAIVAALVAIATAGTVALFLARAGRRPTGVSSDRTSAWRPESTVGRLTEALEDAREESRRSRRLAELASSLDLDDVLARTLEDAVGLPGIDAAMLVLPREDEEPFVATNGMSAEEAAKQPVSTSGAGARAVRVSYRYGETEEASAEGGPIRGGVAVPLRADSNEILGTLAVFWRGSDRSAAEEELAELEKLAAGCGPAIRNAQRFREARRLADLDALTGLHNRRYFHETLERECVRAERYERRLALILVDVDDFKSINDRLGHLGGDSVLETVSKRLRSVVRRADVPCRIGGDEFAVILPESNLGDAEHLYRRIQLAVASRPIEPAGRIDVSAGVAELRPGDDAVALFQRADDALYRAKRAGKGQVREAADLQAPGTR